MSHHGRRAIDDAEKREIVERLYALWTTGNLRFMRLGQLIGNVYHSTDSGGVALYYAEDYPLLEKMEERYRSYRDDLPYIPTMVCTAHLRFLPCRHGSEESPCVMSADPQDIAKAAAFQKGE